MNDIVGKFVSVVIPAYNEQDKIGGTISKINNIFRGINESFEIIVVDDGSTDKTGENASNLGVKVVAHTENKGYGKSLKDGISVASGEYVLIVDADGTYDIGKIPLMVKEIKNTDLVVAKRVFNSGGKGDFKSLARSFFAYWTSYYMRAKIEDLNSGLRIFRKKDVLDEIERYPDEFSFTSTMTVLFIAKNKKPKYIASEYIHRKKGSKFVSGVHMMPIIKLLLGLTRMWCAKIFYTQLIFVFLAAILLTSRLGAFVGVGIFGRTLMFLPMYVLSMFCYLWYVYMRGKYVR